MVIMAVIFVPVALGFGGGVWVSQQAQVSRQKKDDAARLKDVSQLAQILVEMVSEELETIRMQAWGLSVSRTTSIENPPPTPSGKILHWAELEFQKGGPGIVKHLSRSPFWNGNASIEEAYLRAALESLNLQEVRQKGMSLLRIRKEAGGRSEWLSLAFPAPGSEQSVLLALIDPSSAFLSLQRWASHSQGGKSRSFLIGSDGHVFAHSQKTFADSDFSGIALFQNLLQRAFQGTMTGGAGDFTSIDRLPVGTAFYKLGQLPLALVVEEVNSARLYRTDGGWIAILTLFTFALLAFLVLGCALILSSYLVKTVTLTVQPEAPYPGMDREGIEGETENEFETYANAAQRRNYFTGDELLLIDTIQSNHDRHS
jgi:hypothetical protein